MVTPPCPELCLKEPIVKEAVVPLLNTVRRQKNLSAFHPFLTSSCVSSEIASEPNWEQHCWTAHGPNINWAPLRILINPRSAVVPACFLTCSSYLSSCFILTFWRYIHINVLALTFWRWWGRSVGKGDACSHDKQRIKEAPCLGHTCSQVKPH